MVEGNIKKCSYSHFPFFFLEREKGGGLWVESTRVELDFLARKNRIFRWCFFVLLGEGCVCVGGLAENELPPQQGGTREDGPEWAWVFLD